MQIRNNYDKHVFNGDSGTIEEIDLQDRIMKVSYAERIVEYESSELDEIVLAYAITIQKAKDLNMPLSLFPIFMQHFTLLQRNLLYTQPSRALKNCVYSLDNLKQLVWQYAIIKALREQPFYNTI